MNSFIISSIVVVYFTQFVNSLAINSTTEKASRVLFSLQTPIWLAEGTSKDDSYRFQRVHSRALHDAIKFYENPENMAGLGIKQDDRNNWYFTGHIGDNDKSRTIPKNLDELWHKYFGDSAINRNSKKSEIKVDNETSTRNNNLPFALPPYNGSDPIYLRILLFVSFKDQYFTSDRELGFYKLLIYLVSFWNAVDMRYAGFHFPSIKFHIAGIVIGNNKWAPSWLQKDDPSNIWLVQVTEAFKKFQNFIVLNDPLHGDWDLFISQSDIKLSSKFNSSSPDVSGAAFLGKTCNFNPSISNHYKGIVFVDNFLFRGIDIVAHEIGHSFGSSHDGSNEASCNDHQLMMSPYMHNPTSAPEIWSWCSKFQILKYLRNHTKECWKFTPKVDKIDQVPEILPGSWISLEKQCTSYGLQSTCNESSINCEHLYCREKILPPVYWSKCHDIAPPLDGTPCENNGYCKNKKCVLTSEF